VLQAGRPKNYDVKAAGAKKHRAIFLPLLFGDVQCILNSAGFPVFAAWLSFLVINGNNQN